MTWVTPYHQHTDFSTPLTIDDKITIFVNAIRGWQLEIADQCINGRRDSNGEVVTEPIQHAGFAALHIVMSYFETVARYMTGSVGTRNGKRYFREGILSIFPELHEWKPKYVDLLVKLLYSNVRGGLYHTSRTGPGISISGSINHPIILVPSIQDSNKAGVMINPHLLTPRLLEHLAEYERQLKDSTNDQLRANFERRFDDESSRRH